MKKTIAGMLALALCFGLCSVSVYGLRAYDVTAQEYDAFSEAVHEADGSYEVIVKTDGTRPDFRALHPATTVQGPCDAYVLCFTDRRDMLRAIDEAQTMAGVLYAEENGVVTAQNEEPFEPEPSYMSYAAQKIGYAQFASQLLERGQPETVTVAVVDSGITTDLPIFDGRLLEGVSFVKIENSGDYSPYTVDIYEHGTGVASIIADCTQTLPVDILPIKVLDDKGGGSFLDVANGICYAAEHGADVVNLSITAKSCSKYLHDAIDYATDHDCLPVAAAGNFAADLDKQNCCPAHLTQCITVSGCDADDNRYPSSCFGSAIDLCAPAQDVPCLKTNGSLGYADGTSFAAPHVSAVAAMLQIYQPEANCAALSAMLMRNVRDLGDPGFDTRFGWGMPDLHKLNGTQYPQPEERTTIGMQIKTLPDRTVYYYREAFDPTGFSAMMLYSDGTRETVTTGFTFIGTEHMTRGMHTVSAVLDGQHTEFDVEVRFHVWQWFIWYCLLGFLWY